MLGSKLGGFLGGKILDELEEEIMADPRFGRLVGGLGKLIGGILQDQVEEEIMADSRRGLGGLGRLIGGLIQDEEIMADPTRLGSFGSDSRRGLGGLGRLIGGLIQDQVEAELSDSSRFGKMVGSKLGGFLGGRILDELEESEIRAEDSFWTKTPTKLVS